MAKRIEAAVAHIEKGATLEVVVRIAPRVDRYLAVSLGWALAFNLIGLAVLIFSPVPVTAQWLLPNVAFMTLVGYVIGRVPAVIRLVMRRAALHRRAEVAARADFVAYAVDATRSRTGCMVFVGVLEQEIVLHLDHGAQAAAPEAAWGGVHKLARDGTGPVQDRLLAVLEALAPVATRYLPAHEDNPNELSNRPMIG